MLEKQIVEYIDEVAVLEDEAKKSEAKVAAAEETARAAVAALAAATAANVELQRNIDNYRVVINKAGASTWVCNTPRDSYDRTLEVSVFDLGK